MIFLDPEGYSEQGDSYSNPEWKTDSEQQKAATAEEEKETSPIDQLPIILVTMENRKRNTSSSELGIVWWRLIKEVFTNCSSWEQALCTNTETGDAGM